MFNVCSYFNGQIDEHFQYFWHFSWIKIGKEFHRRAKKRIFSSIEIDWIWIEIKMELRTAIFPLYIISKVLCTCPFSLKTLRPSLFGSLITICQAIGYTFFHLWMVNHDMSSDSAKNLIRQLIDSYNRYSGFCAFCFLVIASMRNQAKIVSVIRNIEVIDRIFEQKLDTPIDNRQWRRYEQMSIACITILKFHLIIFHFQQQCLSANLLLHRDDFVFWMAKLLDVHSRFRSILWILLINVPGWVFDFFSLHYRSYRM